MSEKLKNSNSYSIVNTVEGLLEILQKEKKIQLELCSKMMEADSSKLYPLDLLALGAVNRSLSLIRGFCTLIESRNLQCAAPLLRMQLDNALRFFAAFLVEDPHEFVIQILKGKQVRNLKDRKNNKMTDYYLVEQLSVKHEWVKSVYHETCSFVHLSNKHIFATAKKIEPKERVVENSISEFEANVPETMYQEAVMAFISASRLFNHYLDGWVFTKDNPDLVDKMKAEMSQDEIDNYS